MSASDASLSDFTIALKRQFHMIAYIAGPVLAIFIGVGLGWPSEYRSAGVIRIDQQLGGDNRAVDQYAEYYVETLASQVFTRENFEAWIERSDLLPEISDQGEKISALRRGLGTGIVTTPVLDPFSGREREVVTGFTVSYQSHSRQSALAVAQAATDAFLAENRRSRQLKGEDEIEFYRGEVESYRAKIAEVEARLAEFKERNSRRLPELVQLNMTAMDRVERDLETTQLQIDNLRRERTILQNQLNQIPATSNEAIQQLAALQNEYVRISSIYQDNHPNVVSLRRQIELLSQSVDSSAAIPILRQQQEELNVALDEARERYSEDHPDVRQLVRSTTALSERIATLSQRSGNPGPEVGSTNDLYVQLDTQIKAIDTQIFGLNGRVNELRLKRDEYEGLLLETPQVEREYQELLRDLANARQLYEETQSQQREAELALALQQGTRGEQLVLAQAPSLPGSPSWPPRIPIVMLGFILATGMGIGVATLREVTSVSVRSARDAYELCGAPPIALIPLVHNQASRIVNRIRGVGFLVTLFAVGALAYVGAQGL